MRPRHAAFLLVEAGSIGLAAALLLMPTGLAQPDDAMDVWVLSSLERAGITDVVGKNRFIELSGARAESESFQICLRASEETIRRVEVQMTDLARPDGTAISSSNFSMYLEHFVWVSEASPNTHGSNRSLGAGYYPDALLPLSNVSGTWELSQAAALSPVKTGQVQPLWVDLWIPRDTPPGVYRGEISISAGSDVRTLPIAVNVWNFELPVVPSLKSSFGYRRASPYVNEELLRNKLMPQRVDRSICNCASQSEAERNWMEQYGLAATDTGLWSGADIKTCKMSAAPSSTAFERAAQNHARGLFLFNYTADEVGNCPNIRQSLKSWARNMRSSGIKNLVVMAPTPDLLDDGSGTGRSVVDIWVVLPAMYDRSKQMIEQALRKGDEVWSYNTLSQDGYSPKWLIDYSPIDYRIQPGFISQSLGMTGLLYWRVDNWSAKQWDDVNNQGVFAAANFPGEGILLYPGMATGTSVVLPSIRLKELRDGVEDYEYVEMLKHLGRAGWALDVARTVGRDWMNWTRDPAALQSARHRLGEEIDRLMSDATPPPATAQKG